MLCKQKGSLDEPRLDMNTCLQCCDSKKKTKKTCCYVQEAVHKAGACSGCRATVGSQVLLGIASSPRPASAGQGSPQTSPVHDLNILTELEAFGFDKQAALVMRSQLEGADVTLPARFIKVCSVVCICSHRISQAAVDIGHSDAPLRFAD